MTNTQQGVVLLYEVVQQDFIHKGFAVCIARWYRDTYEWFVETNGNLVISDVILSRSDIH